MQVPIGEMREPVVVLVPVLAVDESGGEILTYGQSDPIFVSIRAISASEKNAFGQIDGDVTHVAFGHWQDFSSIGSNARIRMLETSQEFDCVGAPILSPMRDWAKLTLVYRENG